MVLIIVGAWRSSQFDAYTAISPSVRYAVASALIVGAGSISLVLTCGFCAWGCWETPSENRCEFICVRRIIFGLWCGHFGTLCNVMKSNATCRVKKDKPTSFLS